MISTSALLALASLALTGLTVPSRLLQISKLSRHTRPQSGAPIDRR